MKLHIIRHAKTAQESISGRDFDRELLPRGKRQCATLQKHLSSTSWGLVHIYCSKAIRTSQTLERIASVWSTSDLVYNEEFYLCSMKTWLETIWKTPRKNDIVIIGHNFSISELLEYLTGVECTLATAEYACVEFEADQWNDVSKETGTIVHQFRPLDR